MSKLQQLLDEKEISNGNNSIAEFMPDMKWFVPPNTNYTPYWRQFTDDGFVCKDYTAGSTTATKEQRFVQLGYHNNWNRLKPVIDRIFTYSLAFREETQAIRDMSIVVDIIPAWKACVKFAIFAKSILEEANK